MTKVRTRFAPSPTGFAHIGNLRTALFAYLTAKHFGGDFILRLEDTDKNREVDGADEYILSAVKTLGFIYDEGPDIGGKFAPYRQSERLDHYKKWALVLVDKGRAFADPYTPEQIQKFRDEAAANKKAFRYRDFRPTNPPAWDGTMPLRFKSEPRDYAWRDEVMGDLSAGADAIDDFVLIKSDGFPTYNFAHIIDDLEMEITHIIRGQEFISSTPNYLNLYEALEIEHPIFATMPHILNETGNKKLGKRDGAKDAMEYLRDGILVEALDNFIASCGWNDGTEQEIFSMDELIEKFTLDRVGRSGARFDPNRLVWMNGQWIKRLSVGELFERTNCVSDANRSGLPTSCSVSEARQNGEEERSFWGENGANTTDNKKKQVLAVVQDRLKTLADLPALTEYFFARPEPNWAMVDDNKQLKKLTRGEQVELLCAAVEKLEHTEWDFDKLQMSLNELLEITESKPPILFGIIRFALTWAPFSPGLPETMVTLGKDETLARISTAVESAK
ncbi:glutamate--tRNA ligase [Candidatus Saccharibacteria bacterium]|nr:glutamate--tRNA ligase [Candidatus Saccharibacteria bacterium]MCL1962742.1 glutamate--tRNA ligase [Candidatus Saccharibacteria bacterium]